MIDITSTYDIMTILALIIALISLIYVVKLYYKILKISDISAVDDLIRFQNSKIAEITLKVDLLSKKLSQDQEEKQALSEEISNSDNKSINKPLTQSLVENSKETDLEKAITKALADRELTSSEIQKLVGRTREHVSRTLKKMVEEGKLERDESHKPYKYKLIQNVK